MANMNKETLRAIDFFSNNSNDEHITALQFIQKQKQKNRQAFAGTVTADKEEKENELMAAEMIAQCAGIIGDGREFSHAFEKTMDLSGPKTIAQLGDEYRQSCLSEWSDNSIKKTMVSSDMSWQPENRANIASMIFRDSIRSDAMESAVQSIELNNCDSMSGADAVVIERARLEELVKNPHALRAFIVNEVLGLAPKEGPMVKPEPEPEQPSLEARGPEPFQYGSTAKVSSVTKGDDKWKEMEFKIEKTMVKAVTRTLKAPRGTELTYLSGGINLDPDCDWLYKNYGE